MDPYGQEQLVEKAVTGATLIHLAEAIQQYPRLGHIPILNDEGVPVAVMVSYDKYVAMLEQASASAS